MTPSPPLPLPRPTYYLLLTTYYSFNYSTKELEIKIDGLSKIYSNGHRALHNINLEIETGMYGLLGPNGAGKSTLMRILVTLMMPSRGSVTVNGMDLKKHRGEVRAMLGYLPQDFRFFARLRTWEFLDYAASLAGVTKTSVRRAAVEDMLDRVGLFDVRNRMASRLSGGMKRRLGIAQALIGDPKIIIIDEPTTGLDPEERIRFRNILSDLGQKEVIIILSTHIVGDISSTCRNMALLNKGEVVYAGAPDALVDKSKGKVWQVNVTQEQFERMKEEVHIITSVPSLNGWDLEVVADSLNGLPAVPITPNLEHAYVYFVEYLVSKESGGRM